MHQVRTSDVTLYVLLFMLTVVCLLGVVTA
jgi:hypothetical protein